MLLKLWYELWVMCRFSRIKEGERKNKKAKKTVSTQVSAVSQFVIIALIYNTCANW